jgi:hypothetical protein
VHICAFHSSFAGLGFVGFSFGSHLDSGRPLRVRAEKRGPSAGSAAPMLTGGQNFCPALEPNFVYRVTRARVRVASNSVPSLWGYTPPFVLPKDERVKLLSSHLCISRGSLAGSSLSAA